MHSIATIDIVTVTNHVVRDYDAETKNNDGWMYWKRTGFQVITKVDGSTIVCRNVIFLGHICKFEPIDE
jgi:hypothetical protein